MSAARTARRALWAAQLVLAGALLLFAVVVARSVDGDAPGIIERTTGPLGNDGTAELAPGRVDVARLLARDPFSPVRSAPEVPYRIGATAAVTDVVRPQRATVRLLGTVVRASGRSFAMCQVAGEAAKVVYPGQSIGGLTLESVAQGSAVFTDETGARVSMRVSRTGE
jgi:hypothetical protein